MVPTPYPMTTAWARKIAASGLRSSCRTPRQNRTRGCCCGGGCCCSRRVCWGDGGSPEVLQWPPPGADSVAWPSALLPAALACWSKAWASRALSKRKTPFARSLGALTMPGTSTSAPAAAGSAPLGARACCCPSSLACRGPKGRRSMGSSASAASAAWPPNAAAMPARLIRLPATALNSPQPRAPHSRCFP